MGPLKASELPGVPNTIGVSNLLEILSEWSIGESIAHGDPPGPGMCSNGCRIVKSLKIGSHRPGEWVATGESHEK